MAKKITLSHFIDKASQRHGDIYDYSLSEYKNYLTPVKIICNVHGVFEQKPNNHLNGAGCQRCASEIVSAKVRGDSDSFINSAINVHGDKFDYSLVEYITTKEKVKIICKKHGVFEQTPHGHLSGKGCKKCSTKHGGFDNDEFKTRAMQVHGNVYDYSESEYIGYKTPLKIVCKKHGAFFQDPNNHLQGKGCSICIGRVSFDTESFITAAVSIHGNKFDYSLVNYTLSTEKVKIVCKDHGVFEQRPANHLSGDGCPICDVKVSKGEVGLFEFVKTLAEDAEQSNRQIIKPKELDIVIPSKNIAIEFNGLRYHSDRLEGRVDTYHLDKTNACKLAGFRLLHIWEDDWRDRQDVVKRVLTHILGANSERVFARKCKVANVETTSVRSFIDENHIQGWASGSSCYALTHNDEIVAAMIFGHHVSNRGSKLGNDSELIRYATSKSVVGGASRLMSAFLRDNPKCENIHSYSSNELYSGEMYKSLGFTVSHVTRPDYKVVEGGVRNHKGRYRLSALRAKLGDKFNSALTERENCRNNGLYRVYDCGLTKWVYKTTAS